MRRHAATARRSGVGLKRLSASSAKLRPPFASPFRTATGAQAPIILEFEKAPGGQGYFGLVEGGPGTIEMRIDDGAMSGNTQHFSATLWLTDTSAGTLTAEVSGQINLVTGRAVLNGVVIGWRVRGSAGA